MLIDILFRGKILTSVIEFGLNADGFLVSLNGVFSGRSDESCIACPGLAESRCSG
jgi:hypothetical protein